MVDIIVLLALSMLIKSVIFMRYRKNHRQSKTETPANGTSPTQTPSHRLFDLVLGENLWIRQLEHVEGHPDLCRGRWGRWVGERTSGKPPCGFDFDPTDPSKVVPNEAEQSITRRMIERFEAGATLTAIADELNREGIPSKMGKRFDHRAIGRILERSAINQRGRSHRLFIVFRCVAETIENR